MPATRDPIKEYSLVNEGTVSIVFVSPGATDRQVRASGLLGTDTLVLTDTQTGERVTYRKR